MLEILIFHDESDVTYTHKRTHSVMRHTFIYSLAMVINSMIYLVDMCSVVVFMDVPTTSNFRGRRRRRKMPIILYLCIIVVVYASIQCSLCYLSTIHSFIHYYHSRLIFYSIVQIFLIIFASQIRYTYIQLVIYYTQTGSLVCLTCK